MILRGLEFVLGMWAFVFGAALVVTLAYKADDYAREHPTATWIILVVAASAIVFALGALAK